MCFVPTGHPVKQADTVMLGYPLGLQMSPEIRRNDLEAYELVTDPNGPAMTWVRHSMLYVTVLEIYCRMYFLFKITLIYKIKLGSGGGSVPILN